MFCFGESHAHLSAPNEDRPDLAALCTLLSCVATRRDALIGANSEPVSFWVRRKWRFDRASIREAQWWINKINTTPRLCSCNFLGVDRIGAR